MFLPNGQSQNWYQALTIKERLALLQQQPKELLSVAVNPDLANQRLERWKSQPPFNQEPYFSQRLTIDTISEAEFLQILGESVEGVGDRSPTSPNWLIDIEQAFATDAQSEPINFSEAFKDIQTIDFLNLIEPLIAQGRDRLQAGIKTLVAIYPDLPFNPDTIATLLFVNLPQRLLSIISRTLVLELNVARLQGQLQGETPEQRFQSFTERLRQRDIALSILQEYPVLARQALLCINHWVSTSTEFLQHLCQDWEPLRSQFTPNFDPGVLTEVSAGEGDSHREGRSVIIAKFSSGFRVVYKPRSLSLDLHFQELLHWINERGAHSPFRLLNLIDRGFYGWVEFIDAKTCTSTAEIQRFYERQGGYLALLYALEAADFHHENLIAAGEHPILLDLEALFHPRISGANLNQADQLANHTLGYSVFGIGLLPHRIWSTKDSIGIDLSGLGNSEGQLTPHEVPRWQKLGTDEMKLTRQRVEMYAADNQPTLNHEKVNVLDYAEELTRGFTSIYQLLLKYRQEFLAASGPLAHFAGDTVRVIARATRTYAMLLMESFHPDVLRNAIDRDRHFDHLWLAVEQLPHLAKLISTEQEDLHNGDIPMFTTRPDSKHLWSSRGKQLTDFLEQSGLDSVRQHVQQMSELDLNRQLWIIQASLTSLSLEVSPPKAQISTNSIPSQTIASPQQFLQAACAVGDRLETLALRGETDAAWIGLTLVDDRHWSLTPLGFDLYDGLPGVVLFLAYLGEITQDARYSSLARGGLKTLQRLLTQHPGWISQIGGFTGWGGLIYTFSHLEMLWQQPDLIHQVEQSIDLLPELIEADQNFDMISGAAGCLAGLLTHYRQHPSTKTLAIAIQCGDHLLNHAQEMAKGCGWVIPRISPKPLAGFSHGNAGIAWALLALAHDSGMERFHHQALQAIDYERSLFSRQNLNWPDLREFETAVRNGASSTSTEIFYSFMSAWCHGAPGIGLARLQCLTYWDDSEIHSEIETAIQTTIAQGFGNNHSLCHGDLGNLDLLLQAHAILGNPQWKMHADRLGARILDSIQQQGWRCGIPLGVESPGLMTGLAGIGYGLLRVAEPDRIPSVLTLAPPLSPDRHHQVHSLTEVARSAG